jgi:3'(2'), 5'-bisphosphate nucleotidase
MSAARRSAGSRRAEPPFDRERALAKMISAARVASRAIMKVYSTSDFGVEMKGVNDPVTRADKQANAILIDKLGAAFPGIPVVAEESAPDTYQAYRDAERAFFVDPLDGTREFVARNGEFCVMIGLAEKGRASLGVVFVPTEGRVFAGDAHASQKYAFELLSDGKARQIHIGKKGALKDATCIISRSHRSPETDAILLTLGCKKLVPYGSAGLKALQVATHKVDLYCHPGPSGCRWDSCAVEAIVVGAGGVMTTAEGKRFDYRTRSLKNSKGVLAGNPILHEKALAKLLPSLRL